MTRMLAVAAAFIVILALGTTTWLVLGRSGTDRFAQCREGRVAGGAAAIGGPFSLVRDDGVRVSEAEVIDRPTLIYFGYTFCPDVCPLDMARNGQAIDILRENGMDVGLAMVSVDPERDTPEVIGEYVKWMHPDAVGLTGSTEEIEAIKGAYRVFSAKAGEGEDYLVDHSTFTYLMSQDHGFLEFFRRDVEPEAMAARVGCFVERL